jgi:ankyrin repeat protein
MDIATTLLEYGAKANAESKAGFTPLHLSSQEGHTDMSTLLIEHQADTNHKAKVLECHYFLGALITRNTMFQGFHSKPF